MDKKHGPITLFVDNKSAMSLAANPVHPDRNLHIHARFFYIRQLVEGKHYVIAHAPSYDMLADILCTFKSPDNFVRLYTLLMNNATYVQTADGVHEWKIGKGAWYRPASKGGEIIDAEYEPAQLK